MAGPIRISILANASQAKREMDSVSKSTQGLGSKVGKFGKTAGIAMAAGLAVAGAAAIKFGADSVKAASDAQQSVGATGTVFGKFADTVIKTSAKAATKYGLSANVYRENANLLGSLFKNQGVATDKLAGKTEQMVGIGADLAATFGGTTTDAVNALGAAFKGEFDSLEKYGISIKQSDVNARLAAKGQDKLTGAALKQAEQIAKTELIMKQSAQTRGAFAKESNTLAHQQQVLGAQFDNLKVKVGSFLLPILTKLLTVINANLIPAFNALGQFLSPLVAKFKEFFTGLGEGNGRVSELATFFQTRVVPAVQGIVTAFQGMVAVVLPIIHQVVAAITVQWGKIQPQVRSVFNSVKNIIVSALSIIRSVVTLVTAAVAAIWRRFGGTILRYITTTMRNMADVIKNVFKVIEGIFKVVSSALRGDWQGMWTGIKQILSGALGVIKALISQAWNVIRTITTIAWGAVKAVVSKAWSGIKSAVSSGISNTISLVRSLPGKITGALGDLGSLLADAGRQVIQGLIDGIGDKIDDLQAKLGAVTNLIPDWKGPREKDRRLLRPAGRLIISGLIQGFDDGTRGVAKFLSNLTKKIKAALDKTYDGKQLFRVTREWVRWLKRADNALVRNARAQDRNNARLKKAHDHLKNLIKARKEYAASVAASVVSTGNITSLGKNDEDQSTSITALLDQLRDRVAAAKRFASLIRTLTKKGLNKTSLQQILDAGVEGGLGTAEAIASGGQAAIREVNSLTAQLTATGKSLGDSTAATMHNSGIRAAQGFVRGLMRQSRALDRAARQLARMLATAVRKALGIRSPSRVFAGIGEDVTKGLVIGLDDYKVKKAGEALASSLQGGFGTPALDAYDVAVSSSSRNKITVTLTAEQLSDMERGRKVQLQLDAYKAAGGRASA